VTAAARRRCVTGASSIVAFLAQLIVPAQALAADVAPAPFAGFPGLELGVHVGIAHPGGSVGAGSAATTPTVSAVAPTWIPVGLDAGVRLSPRVYLGATAEWGPTLEQANGSCFACNTASAFQAEGEARFYMSPRSLFDPWISLGAGWEVMHVALGSSPGTTASATYDGPVLGTIKVGLDVRWRAIALAPYFGLSLAEYTSRSLDPAPSGASSTVGALALHEWFTLGVRATYGPYPR